MKKLMKLFAILSVSFLCSCTVPPPRQPVGEHFAVVAHPSNDKPPYALVFNLATDYDENLKLKPGVKGIVRPITLDNLDRHWCHDSSTEIELKEYAMKWKARYLELAKSCGK